MQKTGLARALVGLITILTVVLGTFSLAKERERLRPQNTGSNRQRVLDSYAHLPLAFAPNEGQVDSRVHYYAQTAGQSIAFTSAGVAISSVKGQRDRDAKGLTLVLRFVGANPDVVLEGQRLTSGRVNHLVGDQGSEWGVGLPTFREVIYRDLWPGIDMAFRGEDRKLKYELILDPEAQPQDVRLAYAGASGLSLSNRGALKIATSLGTVRDSAPVTYQNVEGHRTSVDSRFVLGPKGKTYGFEVETYNPDLPLVIDPGLAYSTFLGGTIEDEGVGIAVDDQGSAYVTGRTFSADYPVTPGAFDPTFNGTRDAFVTKLNPAGSALEYSTFLGGAGDDAGRDIDVDPQGSAYITGDTSSSDFPVTAGAYDPSYNFGGDVYVTKLNPAGSALEYSTFVGGTNRDQGAGIAVDNQGEAYVTGNTASTNYPVTANAPDPTFVVEEAFVTKLNSVGSALVYSTFLGGSGGEVGHDIAVNAQREAHVTGNTESPDFPVTSGAFDPTFNGSNDAIATKLDKTGSTFVYSTFLGGVNSEQGFGIAVDPKGSAYVAGVTGSANYPITSDAFDPLLGGFQDAFTSKLNPLGSALEYSTFLGGLSGDRASEIDVDPQGSAFVTGTTSSPDYPTTPDAYDSLLGGIVDAFMTKLEPDGTSLEYSTFLGGTVIDDGGDIAVDPQGSTYVTGTTDSPDYPTTPEAYDSTFNGVTDAFVTKLLFEPPGAASVSLSPSTAENEVGTSHTVTATAEDSSGQPVEGVEILFSVTGSTMTSGSCTTGSNGECEFTYEGPQFPGEDVIIGCADNDDSGTSDSEEPCGTATKTWLLPSSTAECKVTNGGFIFANSGGRGSFGGNGKASHGEINGHQIYQDHGPTQSMTVQSTQMLSLTCNQDQTLATIFGVASVDQMGLFLFRIDMRDLGEPGRGRDTYRIIVSNGYDSGEHRLEGGNIQIH